MAKKKAHIKRIAMLAELTDGSIHQILISEEEQKLWLGVVHNFYNPIRLVKPSLEGVEFKDTIKS